MRIKGKLKREKRGKIKGLANCKPFIICEVFLIVFLVCVNKYLSVPVYASESTVQYYSPEEVGQITIGDMVISLQNASGFTVSDPSYVNAIKNNMTGSGKTIDDIMEMEEGDAVQALNVYINNAEQAGATKLSNSLSISTDMANYLNGQNSNAGIVAQTGGEMLYESIKETYKANTEDDTIIGRSQAVIRGALKHIGEGLANSPRDMTALALTGLAGTMFGIPGAVVAGLNTGLFSKNVATGSPLNTPDDVLQYANYGENVIITFDNAYIYYTYVPNGYFGACHKGNYQVYAYHINASLPCTITVVKKNRNSGVVNKTDYNRTNTNFIGCTNNNSLANHGIISGVTIFDTKADLDAYLASIRNNPNYTNNPKSPDVIGAQGNLNYDDEDMGISINQVYNPQTEYFTPININDNSYGDYINTVNQNTNNNDYSDNGTVYNNYVTNNYITNAPALPTPTPTPIIPPQPDIPVIPDIDGLTAEEIEELTDNMIPNLSQFFPFCIPFDIMMIASAFSTDNREPIVMEFDLNLGMAGTYHVNIDLTPWDDIAALARGLELALFILGLAQYAKIIEGNVS